MPLFAASRNDLRVFRAISRRVLLGVAAFTLALFGLQLSAQAVPGTGGVFIVITGMHVGNPVMGTQDSCRGWVEHGQPVIPVTVNAAFFGEDPVGPYATVEWNGGFGDLPDDHFGTATAHAHYQHFHLLAKPSALVGWHGPGQYRFQGLVQDVGLGGGFAITTKDHYLAPPSPTVAKVKCTLTPTLGPKYVVDQVVGGALGQLKKLVCPECVTIKTYYDRLKGYSDALDGLMYDSMVDDPPDASYQQLATPVPAPVLPAPAGGTPSEETAYTQLATELAGEVGVMRSVYTTVNRVWGADNAADTYWHRKQLLHLADLTDQMAASLDALPALRDAMVSAFTDFPTFTVGASEVNDSMSELEAGLPDEEEAALTDLGVSRSDQLAIAELFSTYVDPLSVTTRTGQEALADNNDADLAAAMRTWGKWARSAIEEDPPVVTSASPATLPASGGVVTLAGSHLKGVTGVNFGPSTPDHGQGVLLSGCSETACQVTAPPGHGTVDVVAVAPGGTSKKVAAAQLTYTEPDVPHVTSIFPTQGAMTGGTQVSVFGSGLAGGRVDFGTVPADEWKCQATRCTAKFSPDPRSSRLHA